MKLLIAFIAISATLATYGSVSTGEKITAKNFNESTLGVGAVQHSLLTQTQFQAQHGDCWVKMSGQSVAGSDYETITGKSTLPNSAGRFLRDIGGNAPALGETQEDAFQGHHHNAMGYGNNGGSLGPAADGSSGDLGQLKITSPKSDGVNGTPRTANETRPKNLGINLFVKINHKCS